MFVAVLGYSLVPLFVAWGGSESPFIFNTLWRVGALVGYLLFLVVAYRQLLFRGGVWVLIWQRVPSLAMLLWIVLL